MRSTNYIANSFIITQIGILVILFINPLLGFIVSTISIFTRSSISVKQLYLFITSITFLLAYLNSTKIPSSDTVHYLEWFQAVDRNKPIDSFLYYRGVFSLKDPLFTVISIVLNYLTFGSIGGYLFFCTSIIYLLQFFAVVNVAKRMEINRFYIALTILVLAFCNPLFIQSVHAIRQMMATAMLLYSVSYRVVYGKNNWYMLIASLLTHFSVVLFIPFIILPFFYKKFSIVRLAQMVFSVVGVVLLSKIILPFLAEVGEDNLSEFATQVGISMNNNEMTLGLRGFLMYNIPILVLALLSFINGGWTKGELMIYYFLYIIVFSFVLINPISTELSIRYGFYIWSLIPYCILAFIVVFRRNAKVIILPISILFVLVFFNLLARDPSFPKLMFLFLKPFPLL